jgi:hypothetical protein
MISWTLIVGYQRKEALKTSYCSEILVNTQKTKFCHNVSDYNINNDNINCVFIPNTIFVKNIYINRIKISY